MKLLFSPTSPYVRKVRIVAIEKGLADRIELVDANPWTNHAAVAAINPLGKVPALVTDDGSLVYDSPVICEYLDGLAPTPRLIPPGGAERFAVLRRQALADGVLDAAVGIVLERRRPPAEQSAATTERHLAAIGRALAAFRAEIDPPAAVPDLGQIALAVAIGYLEFRLPELGAARSDPAVAAFWATIGARASFAATQPG